MLFNSYQFIIFLIILIGVCALVKGKRIKVILIIASLFYYSYWNINHLNVFIASLVINYLISWKIQKSHFSKQFYLIGITFNLALLGYYKYYDFFIDNINTLVGLELGLLKSGIPIGISFFTFQQIAYLSDIKNLKAKPYHAINYILFISFFPQLIAGPIVHHEEFIPQIKKKDWFIFKADNFAKGIFLFVMGLSKKVLVADNLSLFVNIGFDSTTDTSLIDSLLTILSYTFQIYFDFSGYVDMATGISLFFNIKLPLNFLSPYQSQNIQIFWRSWHITLGKFLRDYVYIPLGGGRRRMYANLVITFVVGGFWHGANWTFVIWGLLHGIALVVHRLFTKTKREITPRGSQLLTFGFVSFTWVFFRSENLSVAFKMLKSLFVFRLNSNILSNLTVIDKLLWGGSFIVGSFIVFGLKNNYQILNRLKYSKKLVLAVVGLFIMNFIFMNSDKVQEFIYYDF